MPGVAEVQWDGALTNISIQYRNKRLIAEDVMPRATAKSKEGKYKKYAKKERFTIPSTRVGPKSKPNEVDWSTEEDTYACKDYGLDDFVSNDEIANAEAPIAVEGDTAEFVTDLVALDREKRVADLVFNAANYPTGNKVDLANAWDNTGTRDAVDDILVGVDACFMDPTILVIGIEAWRKLQRNVKLIQAIKGTIEGQSITPEDVAKYFELEEVLVGQSRVNTAKRGQSPVWARVWGKHAALLRRVRNPGTRSVHFGTTFEWGTRVAGRIPDQTRGLRGGLLIRVGETVDEKVVAGDVAYFFENAVA